MPEITVQLDDRSYPVLIGPDKRRRLERLVKKVDRKSRVFAFYDAQFYALHGHILKKETACLRGAAGEMVLPGAETTKSLRTVRRLHDFMIGNRISRSDLILAVGGGVITDVVGFAAATVLRGVRWAAVPTTLLGMVDAAIGGKTGVNHPRGKNLIGAFWQPSFVLADIRFLGTLSERMMTAGLAEIVKYGGLEGEDMISAIRAYLEGGRLYHQRHLTELVTLSAACKARLVGADEREADQRMLLNLGHTFGHAIEQTLNFRRLSHGEALLLGLEAALQLSILLRPARAKALGDYRSLVRQAMRRVPRVPIDSDAVLKALATDKKRSGTSLRLVVLDRPGRARLVTGVQPAQLKQAIEKTCVTYYHTEV
jgi:3-dehydroquinate synthase